MTVAVTIVRGPRHALSQDPRLRPAGAIVLDPDPDFPVPWAGARLLFARLKADPAPQHRALLSLVLRGLVHELTDGERELRRERAAQPLGYLSHNGMISTPLIDAWAGALAPLCAARVIAIPDLGTFDPESMTLIRELLRRLDAAEQPQFVLGHDPERRANEWLWQRDEDLVAGQLALLELLPGTRIEPVATAERTGAERSAPPVHPLDDDLERRAYRALTATAAPDTATSTLVLEAMRAAFACFGFSAVLRLGLEWLRRDTTLPAHVAAEIHTLIALSAYNRQVETGDNVELAGMLDAHFSAALELDTDPAHRSHLLYRLCINRGRRKGELAEAHALADRAIDEARAVPAEGLAAFLEAWARNGRAYVRARMRKHADGIADCERACELLAIAAHKPGAPQSEVRPSQLVLFDNLAALCEMTGDRERAAYWQGRNEEIEASMPEALSVSAHRWASLLRAQGNLRGAIRHAERGLAEARRQLHPLVEDRYAADLGDLYFRVGDVATAARHFEATLAIRRRSHDAPARLRAELSCAVVALRAGLVTDARANLERALADPACADPGARAEITSALGVLAARAGTADVANDLVDRAIELAVESGARDVLVRVARAAGDACTLLADPAAALDAYARALDIAGADDAHPAPPAELLAVYLGLAAGPDPATWIRRALTVSTAALADPDAWWDLARLLDGVATVAETGGLSEPEVIAAREVARLAVQREDCRLPLDRLARALGDPTLAA